MAQATAVTLALLFDSELEPQQPQPQPPQTAPKIDNPRVDPVAPTPHSHRRFDVTVSLGAAGLAFVLRPLSPAFMGEFGLRIEGFRVGLGVLWIPTQSLPLEPGHVKESMWSGTARACVALSRGERLELHLCSGLFVGAVMARAEGFTENERRVRSWLAVPLELSLADLSGRVGWEVSAAALGTLVHPDFEVENLGAAYRSPRVGAMLTFRAVGLRTW